MIMPVDRGLKHKDDGIDDASVIEPITLQWIYSRVGQQQQDLRGLGIGMRLFPPPRNFPDHFSFMVTII